MSMMVLFRRKDDDQDPVTITLARLTDDAGVDLMKLMYDTGLHTVLCQSKGMASPLASGYVEEGREGQFILAECHLERKAGAGPAHTQMSVVVNLQKQDVTEDVSFASSTTAMQEGQVRVGSESPSDLDIAAVILSDEWLTPIEQMIVRDALWDQFSRSFPDEVPCPSDGAQTATWMQFCSSSSCSTPSLFRSEYIKSSVLEMLFECRKSVLQWGSDSSLSWKLGQKEQSIMQSGDGMAICPAEKMKLVQK